MRMPSRLARGKDVKSPIGILDSGDVADWVFWVYFRRVAEFSFVAIANRRSIIAVRLSKILCVYVYVDLIWTLDGDCNYCFVCFM